MLRIGVLSIKQMTRRIDWKVYYWLGVVTTAIVIFFSKYYPEAKMILTDSVVTLACDRLGREGGRQPCVYWRQLTLTERIDPWDREMHCEVFADGKFRIISLGADGRRGGKGVDTDFECTEATHSLPQ
jgi:hypothetical protein